MNEVRTSLEVGFPGGTLPEAFAKFRGRQTRVIGNVAEFPYEDRQFDVVLMSGDVVSATFPMARVCRPRRPTNASGSVPSGNPTSSDVRTAFN